MADSSELVRVDGEVRTRDNRQVAYLLLQFSPEVLQSAPTSRRLASQLVEKYEAVVREAGKTYSMNCILEIKATVAGSRVVQAVAKIFNVVRSGGGKLYCVGYPDKYITSLAALGLTGSEGFYLFDQIEAAEREVFGPEA